ncbi:MAG: terpene cyclase/mutase family protein [Planctomycetes bacterium]|nr:terpene cyclase/mutase family protein [Planctomycetota bacterium]
MARKREEELYDDEFDDEFEEHEEYIPPPPATGFSKFIQQSPTFAISVIIHGILLFVLALIVVGLPDPEDQIARINTEIAPEEEDPYDPEVPRDIKPIDRTEEPIEEPTEDPEIVEEAVDERNEDATNDDFNELAPSDNNSMSDVPHPNVGASALGVGASGALGGGGRFGGRGGRENLRARGGGGTESAVEAALKWLKRHQSEDGSWKAKDFHEMCNSDPEFPGTCSNIDGGTDEGWESVDVGVTGLSLLAYLGAGHTNTQGNYRRTVQNGLRWLLQVQQPDGLFGPSLDSHANYNHSCAAMAMAEAYAMTQFERLATPAQNAIDYIARSQNEGLGWRYGVRPGDNDSSVSGWMVLALKSAKIAGLHVPEQCFEGAKRWYEIVTNPDYGQVGYTQRDQLNSRLPTANGVPAYDNNQSLTAVALIAKLFMGVPRGDPVNERGAALIVRDLPTWTPKRKIDFYYWYYGSLAIFQMGEPWWTEWNGAMKDTLVQNQRQGKREDADGSWDPIGAWGSAGGRVYATALNCLSLEVYYRYDFIGSNRRE